MEVWQDWLLGILALFIAALIREHFELKKDKKQDEKAQNEKLAYLQERITVLEGNSVSDKEVRETLREFFNPFMDTLMNMQKDVADIKVAIAVQKDRETRQ